MALATIVMLGTVALVIARGGPFNQPTPLHSPTLPSCTIGERATAAAGYAEWASTLLDTEYRLPDDYVPPDLVAFTANGKTVTMREFVLPDLRDLIAAAARDGVTLRPNSGYRSYAEQKRTFRRLAASPGLAARPGHSEHQLGTTVDIDGDRGWLADNAWRFGFVLSYPDERSPELTCYPSEPWHYRYFGRAKAAAIHESGLSPREYLWKTV
jgi:D-alanyl-D-alanine carboxypeptidase